MIIKSKKTKWVTLSLLTFLSQNFPLSIWFNTVLWLPCMLIFANVLGTPTQTCVFVFVFCFFFLFFLIKPRVSCKLTRKGTGIKRYSNFRIYNNSRSVLFIIHSLLPSYTNNGFFFFFSPDFSYFLLISN